jgi:hypothetical protein
MPSLTRKICRWRFSGIYWGRLRGHPFYVTENSQYLNGKVGTSDDQNILVFCSSIAFLLAYLNPEKVKKNSSPEQ